MNADQDFNHPLIKSLLYAILYSLKKGGIHKKNREGGNNELQILLVPNHTILHSPT